MPSLGGTNLESYVLQEWTGYMGAMNVSEEDTEEAISLDQNAVRFHPEKIAESLKEVDHFEALAVRENEAGRERRRYYALSPRMSWRLLEPAGC